MPRFAVRSVARVITLAVLWGLALTAVSPPGPAAAAAGARMTALAANRCLDVTGDNRAAGTPVIIWDCHDHANQRWSLRTSGDLRVFDDALCLQADGSAVRGARAVTAACTGGAGQQWRLTASRTLVHQQSGLCLDVRGSGVARGTEVVLWTCNRQANQTWRLSGSGPDSTPPTPPSGLRSSGLSCRSVTLAWTASSDAVGVSAYDLYHDGQLVTSVSGSTLSATVSVVAGVPWGWYVNARDAVGNVSQASATLTITPPQCSADTVPPTTPTGVAATAAGTTVTVRWSASTDNVGVAGYDILRDGAKVGSVAGSVRTFTDSGLASSRSYAYVVVARDAQGNLSPRSASVSVTTGAACSSAVCGVRQVATDTDIPWGLVTLPDGSVLYSRRDAFDVIRLTPTTGAKTTVGSVPGVQGTDGEGGLMGLAVAPDFSSDPWVYVMHTTATDNRVVRMRYTNGVLDRASTQVLLSGILRNKYHNGGRLRFGPDGMLYVSTGDAQNENYAQVLTGTGALNGKILRMTRTGGVPADNPFGSYVWSYGHRNPQGLAFDGSGRLWQQEFGNNVMDETNLVQRGGNYGWPQCEGTTSRSGSGCAGAGLVAPKRTYPTSEGSCSGITIVRNVLYVACGRGARMYREVISGTTLTEVQQLFVGTYGRLRTVEPSADGGLWLTTTTTGDKDSVANNSNEKILQVTLGG